jgi:hypothetical protein
VSSNRLAQHDEIVLSSILLASIFYTPTGPEVGLVNLHRDLGFGKLQTKQESASLRSVPAAMMLGPAASMRLLLVTCWPAYSFVSLASLEI